MGLICGNSVVVSWHHISSSGVAFNGKLFMLFQR